MTLRMVCERETLECWSYQWQTHTKCDDHPTPPRRNERESARQRDKGMERAQRNPAITEDWKQRVMRTIRTVAQQQEYIASIDIVEALAEAGIPVPDGSKVMGPLMRRAATLGYIEGPVSTRASDRVSHHRGLENVWKSKLY